MLFNSLQFLVFFGFVTFGYFALPNRWRWLLLLISSCYFYMAFVPEYILILFGTIVIDYIAGILIENSSGHKRKTWLVISLISNIGILAFYKYFNFLNNNITEVLGLFGKHNPIPILDIILPIGLSFHTFQAMSYTIEVYRGNQKAEKHFGIYALYVMFYPQLVAGPIERPQNLLHQFHDKINFNSSRLREGLMQMAWGFFKKMVIADRLASVVDECYKSPYAHNSSTLWIAVVFYSFQIYCDFSGYSDIAIGAARVMGINLMENFNAPYFSRSLSEFWRRWHISLSTWFKDYLYIPLGGSRVRFSVQCRNLLIVFLISGLWHGASWNFIIWGGIHGTMLIAGNILRRKYDKLNAIPDFLAIGYTFLIVTIAWIFFRAQTLPDAIHIIQALPKIHIGEPLQLSLNKSELWLCIILIGILCLKDRYLKIIPTHNRLVYYITMTFLIASCYVFGVSNENQFIYFQF